VRLVRLDLPGQLPEHGVDGSGVADVAGEGQTADLVGHGLGGAEVQVVDEHPGAGLGEAAGDLRPQAPGGTGDEGGLAGESALRCRCASFRHVVPFRVDSP